MRQRGGVSLHANVAVPARDRQRLERLCRYVARPPVATERLSRLEDGRLLYRLRHRWRDGTTHVVFEPQELVEKLAALVPPPRFHLVRYHGILGPCASQRGRVVPGALPPAPGNGTSAARSSTPRCDDPSKVDGREPRDDLLATRARAVAPEGARTTSDPAPHSQASTSRHKASPRARRLAWSELLQRVFAVDVLECPRCGGRMRLLAAIHPPDVTQAILDCLDLPSRAPPTAAAVPDFDGADGWPGDFEATL